MGSGKTEAALVGVYQLIADKHAAGLFFALPTQVTSNRVNERVAAFLAQADAEPDSRRLHLAHSTSWLREEQLPPSLHPAIPTDVEPSEHASSGRSWFASSKRALLASYGVGTIDQALLGVVAAKHFFRSPVFDVHALFDDLGAGR
jgi:CRISPR-associated endonuclease/helicase Cas3